MRIFVNILLACCSLTALPAATDPYAPLALYSGSWQVTIPGEAPARLTNQCARVGRYFTCEQTVNGTPGALLIFVPIAAKPGRYYTQNVRPDGLASGRGDLEITGDRWVYTSNWNQGGSTTYYRTTNVLTGKNKIAFEQAESTDNKNWTVKKTGGEVRVNR